ncbi:MAG: ATP synthase delta (OSCP) subunit [Candidatus Magasanikbacteria bacterium]|nr:ATP synthase delta (OSCP) subunit [Candidatus Magasanikbacteria bacterium]
MKKNIAAKYADALIQLLEGKSRNQGEGVITNFVAAIKKQGQTRLLPSILTATAKKLELARKKKSATVVTAHRVSEELQKKFKTLLGKEFVYLEEDARVLGGVMIKMEDVIIDATVKGSLERFKKF